MSIKQSARAVLSSSDVIAGVTCWAVLVPSALAYSSLAGVPPLVGLTGVPLALVGYALFGGSATLIVGADAAVSVLVGSTLAGLAPTHGRSSAVLVLSLLVGTVFIVLRLLRFGWIADLVPIPVLKGFIFGLAVTTSVSQVGDMLGLVVDHRGGNFFTSTWHLARALDTVHWPTAIVGIGSLVALIAAQRLAPKLPSALAVLLAAGVAVALFDLRGSGVQVVGKPEAHLTDTLSGLAVTPSMVRALLPAALAIVVLGFTESLGASQIASDARGERTDPNRELLGLGAANIAVGLAGSYAVTGALSKTAVNVSAGATSRRSTWLVAALSILTLLFLTPMFDYLARPALAAVVIFTMVTMIDRRYVTSLRTASRTEAWVFAAALVGVLFFGVMQAVVAATVISFALLGHRVSRPPVTMIGQLPDGRWRGLAGSPSATLPHGLTVVRPEGQLVFVNSRFVNDRLLDAALAPGVDVVLLDASAVTDVDSTAVAGLRAVVRPLESAGVQLWLAMSNDRVLKHGQGLAGDLRVPTFESLNEALVAFSARDH